MDSGFWLLTIAIWLPLVAADNGGGVARALKLPGGRTSPDVPIRWLLCKIDDNLWSDVEIFGRK